MQVDILVNNAGMLQIGLAEHTKLSVDQHVMNVNFLGVVSLTKAVLPHFLEKEEGHITVISSPGGKLGKLRTVGQYLLLLLHICSAHLEILRFPMGGAYPRGVLGYKCDGRGGA